MGSETLLCTLEVHSGAGDRTRRTFSLEARPRTLEEVVALLQTQDLRLQGGTFDLRVGRSNGNRNNKENYENKEEAPHPLLSDHDVVELFASPSLEGLTFVVALTPTTGGRLASAMLADDDLVHLRIYHQQQQFSETNNNNNNNNNIAKSINDTAVTEKRFIPPRRGLREALAVAVRDAVPQPPPSSVPMQLYAVGNTLEEIHALESEEAVFALIQASQKARTVCRLTYRFLTESKVKQKTPSQQQLLPMNYNVEKGSKPSEVNVCTVKESSLTENKLEEIQLRTSFPSQSQKNEDNFLLVPLHAFEEELPRLKKLLEEEVEEPRKLLQPQLIILNKEKIAKSQILNSEEEKEEEKEEEEEEQKEKNLIRKKSGELPYLEHLFAEKEEEPKELLTNLEQEEQIFLPKQVKSLVKGEGTSSVKLKTEQLETKVEEMMNDVEIEIECALGQSSMVVFSFLWQRDSSNVLQSLHTACISALGIETNDEINLYDRDGIPLRSSRQVCEIFNVALRKSRPRVFIIAWIGHPCTNGLPLQCHVSWGTQEVVIACSLRSENALEDLSYAILEEYDISFKSINDLKIFLCNDEMCTEEILTSDEAYEKLKIAAHDGQVVHIIVSNSRRSPLRRSFERTLNTAALNFALDISLLLGDRFSSRDLIPFFEQYLEKMKPNEKGSINFIALIIQSLSKIRIFSVEELSSFLIEICTLALCAENMAIDVLSNCAVTARLMATRRPFEVLKRFFRRLYKSIKIPEGARGVPLALVTRQIAYAGLRDAKGLLRRDRTILSELRENDYTELFLRLYNSDADMVCRASVASRLSGISNIRSRLVILKEEQSILRADYQHELRHAFDGIRSADVAKFLQTNGIRAEPRFKCLLNVIGSLLATHPVEQSCHWLVERFKGKVGDALDVKLRTFEDSVVPTPNLYRISWDILRPELHHLSLLSESNVASALAYWAYFAVQLVCVNRLLDFPPVPLVDLHEFSPVGMAGPSATHTGVGAVGTAAVTSSASSSSAAAAAVPPLASNKRLKIKYKYSYLCHDLRRESRLPRREK